MLWNFNQNNFLKENPFENVIHKMLAIFLRPKFFHQGVSSTEAKKDNKIFPKDGYSADFNISQQNRPKIKLPDAYPTS